MDTCKCDQRAAEALTLGMWRSAVSGANLRLQWGQSTRSSGMESSGSGSFEISSPRFSACSILLQALAVAHSTHDFWRLKSDFIQVEESFAATYHVICGNE